ncbi:hypothetical protein F2P79_025375 [Pimephales promelas]|nr:hypothetical protein F2P79_025375 [Pimephales promelas]
MGQGVSVLPPAEVASDTDTVMAVVEAGDAAAGIVVEAVETELGSIAPVKISDTTDTVSEHSKDVKCMMSEKSKHSENVCVTDADEIDVEDDVDFEGKAKSVFKIPVKRKKKSSGKAFKQVKKDEGGDDTNVGSDTTGQELTEPADIRNRAVEFFSDLYKSELKEWGADADNFLDGLPKVDEESNNDLQQTLSVQELYTAMMSIENGKSPGIDGLPVEFYKTLWPVIGEDLLTVLNDSLKTGLLPLSCRRAVITLLPKKGDLQCIENWRPVSLLCSESILDNIALIRDVLDASKLLGINSGLISLDQEKAFDRKKEVKVWFISQAEELHIVFNTYRNC